MGRPVKRYYATCLHCGEEFTKTGRESHGGKSLAYCSRECHQRARTAEGTIVRVNNDFGHWFAGFVDGEGYFYLGLASSKTARYPVARIVLEQRRDDAPLLYTIRDTLGMGNIQDVQQRIAQIKGANPSKRLTITKRGHLLALCDLFEEYPLRSKKKQDFTIWAKALRHWHQHRDLDHFISCIDEIKAVREYDPIRASVGA